MSDGARSRGWWQRVVLRLGLFAFALGLLARPAAAQELDVGAFAALHLFSVDNELGMPEDLSAGINDTALCGLRGTFWLWRHFGLAAEAAFGSAAMTVHQGTTLSQSPVTLLTGRAHLIGRYPVGGVTLVALVGGGAMQTLPDVLTTTSRDLDAYSYGGAGVELGLWRRLSLRADIRVAFTGSTVDGAAVSFDQEATLGLAWRFGEADYPRDDSDHDGIPDDADVCPFEAETVNGVRDEDGCPEHPSTVVRYHRTQFVAERGEVRALLAHALPAAATAVAAPAWTTETARGTRRISPRSPISRRPRAVRTPSTCCSAWPTSTATASPTPTAPSPIRRPRAPAPPLGSASRASRRCRPSRRARWTKPSTSARPNATAAAATTPSSWARAAACC